MPLGGTNNLNPVLQYKKLLAKMGIQAKTELISYIFQILSVLNKVKNRQKFKKCKFKGL